MPRTTTSVPDVIDRLLALARALPECAPPVLVADGYPGTTLPDRLVTIGGLVTPTADGVADWSALGAQRRTEDYEVEVTISCWSGGTSVDQKAARDQAYGIFNALDAAVQGDVSLAGAVRQALFARHTLQQASTETASSGVSAEITAHLRVKAEVHKP